MLVSAASGRYINFYVCFMAVPLCFARNTLVKQEWSSLVHNTHKGTSKSERTRVLFHLEDIGVLKALHVEIGMDSSEQDLDDFTHTEWSLGDVGMRSTHLFNILLAGILSLRFGVILYTILWLHRTKWDKISNLLLRTEKGSNPGSNRRSTSLV